jgi:hypothetical protein
LAKKNRSGQLYSTDKLLGLAFGDAAKKNSLSPRRRFADGFLIMGVISVSCCVVEHGPKIGNPIIALGSG